jgi:hypothetical protein
MDIAPSQRFEPVTQFSVFSANRIGKLNELLQVFASNDIHVAAITTVDTSEAGLFRIVVNYPDKAREVLEDTGYPFAEHKVFAIEIDSEADIAKVCAAMTEAEINIDYLYPFLMRPSGKCGLVLNIDDVELASQVLFAHGFKVLYQQDIGR